MPTIFSRIVAGEIPCYKIAEDEKYFAFLDINPLAEGHTLHIRHVRRSLCRADFICKKSC